MNYGKYLTDEILPHWLSISKDEEFGGVFNVFDENSKVATTDKLVWFLGREMWSYAMTYRLVEPRPEYIEMCEHLYAFLKKITPPDGRLPFTVTRDGKTKREQNAGNGVFYYSEMFCAMGCAQYYRICKREEVWESAELYFDVAYDLYQKNKFTTQEDAEEDCKALGLHMAMIAMVQFVRNVGRNYEKFDAAARDVMTEMMSGGFINEEKKCVNEYKPFGNEKLTTWVADMCYPGHVYEAAWFVFCEGEVQNDDRIREYGKKLLDYAMPEGFEELTLLIPTDRNLSKPLAEDLIDTYRHWPNQEAVVAFSMAYYMFGEEKYLDLAKRLEEEAFAYFADREDGRWYISINKSEGKVTERKNKAGHIEGPFHLERYLLAMKSITENGNIMEYMS